LSPRSGTLYLEPRPSRWFAILLVAVHGGALFSLLLTPLPWLLRLVGSTVLLGSLWVTLERRALLLRRAVTALSWDEQEMWRIWVDGGTEVAVRLEPDSFLSPWCVVLNFRALESGVHYSVVLLPDSLDATTFRRLRVRLKTGGPAGSG